MTGGPTSAPSSAPSSPASSSPAGSSGSASSSPSSSPASAPSSAPSQSVGGAAVSPARPGSGGLQDASGDQSAIFDLGPDFDVDLPETSPTELAPQVPQAVPTSEPQAQPPQAPQQAEGLAPAQPVGEPQAPVEQDVSRPASIAEMLQAATQHREQLVEALAKDVFALSPADVEAMESDALGAMPKILAKTYLKAQTSTLQMVQSLVPQMIQSEVQRMFQMAKAEDSFYRGFPELRDQRFRADIMTAAKALRAANPKMSNEQLIQMAGNMVMSMHGVARAAGSAPAPTPQASTPPFAPASNGTIVSQQPTPAANDFWSILSRTDD